MNKSGQILIDLVWIDRQKGVNLDKQIKIKISRQKDLNLDRQINIQIFAGETGKYLAQHFYYYFKQKMINDRNDSTQTKQEGGRGVGRQIDRQVEEQVK